MPVNLQPSIGTADISKKEKPRGEGSRRMSTNSRPPLSHRIRASFEGKKSQDSTSPIHSNFSVSSLTDPEVLRQAIDHAISGDAFQAGIASHIAKLLKPEIKTALDTIEPLVNAVLQHEILLKKTNIGLDSVLLRLGLMTDEDGAVDPTKARLSVHGALNSHPTSEDIPLPLSYTSTSAIPGSFSNDRPKPLFNRNVTHTAGELSQISNSLDLNNNKLGRVVEGIAEITNLLRSNERLGNLKERPEKNATDTSVQTQLDELQGNVRVIITRIGNDLGTNVKAINDHLAGGTPGSETAVGTNAADTKLLHAISSGLDSLKGNLDTGTASHNESLGLLREQVAALQLALDAQKVILGEIKEADNSVEVLAGIQKSNDSHEAHTAMLGELKEKNVQPTDVSAQPASTSEDAETLQIILTEVQKSNEAHEKHRTALEGIKDSDTSAAILAEVQKSNDSHIAHAATLEALKTSPPLPSETTASVDLGNLETQMGRIIETSTVVLAEIQKSNESHISHAAALENIKALPTPPPEIIPSSVGVDLRGLETNMGSIIEKLDNHAAVLDEIKAKHGSVSTGIDARSFDGHFSSITSLLEAHTATLEGIKATDIPTTDFGSLAAVLEAHTATLEEIRARDIPMADFSLITAMLESHTAVLEEIKSKNIPVADFTPITSLLEAHTAVLEEIKTKDGGPSVDLSPITNMLDAHTATLDEIKSKDIQVADFIPITSMLQHHHSATLQEIKAQDGLSNIDFSPITSTLTSHSAILDEIKSKDVQSSTAPAAINMETFETHFNSITGMLAAHTAALDEIKSKAGSSNSAVPAEINTEALDKHFGSITSMLEAHTIVLEDIKSKDTTPSIGPTELNTVAFDGYFNSLAVMLESHTAALDELKSKNTESSRSLMPRSENADFKSFESHFTAIKSALDAHMVVLDDLKSEALAKNDLDAMVVDNMLEPRIMAIKSTLDAHTAVLEELKSNTSTTNVTASSETRNDTLPKLLETLSSHTNLLREIKNADVNDEILTALHELQERTSTAFNTLKESNVSDEILTALHTCNDSQEKLDKSLLELQIAVKTSGSSEQSGEKPIVPSEELESPNGGVDLSGLETQISAVIAILEGQNGVLGEIKGAMNSGIEAHSSHTTALGEIKDVTIASNESHTAHGAILLALKNAANSSNESHGTHTATLGVIRDATAIWSKAHSTQIISLGELKEAMQVSNESHNAHTSTLGDIREATASLNEAHLTHATTLGELKGAIDASNESHASQATVLEGLESIQSAQSSPDTIVESTPASVLDTSALDTQLTSIMSTLDSQTSTLGEIKGAHTSHTITLSEIKEATSASNESHNSHAAILSEIRDSNSPIKDITEVLETHTSLLEGLKEDAESKHDKVKGDIEGLERIVEKTSSKHEENLSRHEELIKEHGDLARENHNGLKGTIAGLALGGIVGAGVMKAVEGGEDKALDVAEQVEEVPEILTEEDKILEEPPVLESEVPEVEESASESAQSQIEPLVEDEVTVEPEVELEVEVSVEDEKAGSEEVLVDQELEVDAILTEPEVIAEPQEDVLIPGPAQIEPELEPELDIEACVEKEAPIEEPTPGEPEAPAQEIGVEEIILAEEQSERAALETTDETPTTEPLQVQEDLPTEETIPQQDPISVEPEIPSESNSEDDDVTSTKEPEVIEKAEEIRTPVSESIEDPVTSQDSPVMEEPQAPESESIPDSDIVPESSKGDSEPEQSAVVEEIPVEEEIIAVEGSEEEADGERIGDEILGDGDGDGDDVIDGDDLKSTEEKDLVVEEEKPTEEVVLNTAEGEIHHHVNKVMPIEEAKPAEESITKVLTQNVPAHLEDALPLKTDGKLPESEERDTASSSYTPTISKDDAVLSESPIEVENLVLEPSIETSMMGNKEISTEPLITESSSEDHPVIEETVPEPPVETQETALEAESQELRTEDISTATTVQVIEPCQEEDSLELIAETEPEIETETETEIETLVQDLGDQIQIQIQIPVESESESEVLVKSGKSLVSNDSDGEISSETTKVVGLLLEESILEPIVESVIPISVSELKDHDQDLPTGTVKRESEEGSVGIENLERENLETENLEVGNESISSENAEIFVDSIQGESIPELVVESEALVLESSHQDQLPVESEKKSVETENPELSNDGIPSETAEMFMEPLQEESIPELVVESEAPVLELNHQDEPPAEGEKSATESEISEPIGLDSESVEDLLPSIECEKKALEIENQEPNHEAIPTEIEENPVELAGDQNPGSIIEAEIPVSELDAQHQFPVQREENSLEPEVGEPIVKELQNSEEQLSPPIGDEETVIETTTKDAVHDLVIGHDAPESIEEAQIIAKDEETPESIEEQVVEIPNEGPATESQSPISNEEDYVVEESPEEDTPNAEVKNENLAGIPETSEEVQLFAENEEKPISMEEQVIEAPHEQEALENEFSVPEAAIIEDIEDAKVREEIAALNAELAMIMAGEEGKGRDPMVNETEKSGRDDTLVAAEIISRNEPKELQVKHNTEEPIDIPEEQPPMESQECLEEQLETESLHTDVIELKEEQMDSVAGEDNSCEPSQEDISEMPVVTSSDLKEETSRTEPKIETLENTIIQSNNELLQHEENIPKDKQDFTQGQTRIAEDENTPEEKSLEVSAESEERISESRPIAGEPEDEDISNEIVPVAVEYVPGEGEVLKTESASISVPVETESNDRESRHIIDERVLSTDIEGNQSLPDRPESEPTIDSEPQILEAETIPEDVAFEIGSKDSESETEPVLSSVQESSTIELEPAVDNRPDVEGESQELDNGRLPVEHLEVIDTQPSYEEHSKNASSVEIGESVPLESGILHENLGDSKELETKSVIPENTSNQTAGSEPDEDNNTAEEKIQEFEYVVEIQSTESSHEEISTADKSQHDSEPAQDEIASNIPLPSELIQDEPIALEEEEYSNTQFSPARDTVQIENHPISEDVIPVESRIAESGSILPNEDEIESEGEPVSREVPVVSDNQYISEESIPLKLEPVLDSEETAIEESNEHTPQDDISHDQFESQIIPQIESQIQPIIEDVPTVPESSELPEDSVSLEDEALIESGNSVIEPTDDQVLENNQNVSDEIRAGRKDELTSEDNISIYPQNVEPKSVVENYRQEQGFPSHKQSLEPKTSASDHIDADRSERKLKPEATQLDLKEAYSTSQAHINDPEAAVKQRYSSFEETPLDTRTSSNHQENSERSEPELETTYASPNYRQGHLSESHPTQNIHFNDPELAQHQPIIPADQMMHQNDTPTSLPTALSAKMSTETLPAGEESRRPSVSPESDLRLPVKTSEGVESIRENPGSGTEPIYPIHDEPVRSSTSSRLPIMSPRAADNITEDPKPESQSNYPIYNKPEPEQSSSISQGFNINAPDAPIKNQDANQTICESPRSGSETLLGHSTHDELAVRSSESESPLVQAQAQGFNFGLPGTSTTPVESQREIRELEIRQPENVNVNRRSNVRDLLRQFEGGESSSPSLASSSASSQNRLSVSSPRDRVGTGSSIPRLVDIRSSGRENKLSGEGGSEGEGDGKKRDAGEGKIMIWGKGERGRGEEGERGRGEEEDGARL
ncbi:hypothetical protein SBOR_7834 [Sclerotinia borealis F-4128]|uniref:Uncharacterized protein n=1 Tax=Sclerotinia borealis (strain F-4128) TaxID=1432307 RepID=W9C7N7_SCLBF|nr:hypothetical protein SBOR_7834 [Sclerotinia borealis F-4128]